MLGLSSAPFYLHSMVGFDVLYVCSFCCPWWNGLRRVPCADSFGEFFVRLAAMRWAKRCRKEGFSQCSVHSHLTAALCFIPHISPLTLLCMVYVLDLGTGTLVHRLVRVFPRMCKNHHPVFGSTMATCRLAKSRVAYLERRKRAVTTGLGCTVSATMKQAAFMGVQQRAGVPMLPFVFFGLLGLGPRRTAPVVPSPAAAPAKPTSTCGRRFSAARPESAVDADEDLFDPDRKGAKELLPTNCVVE